MTNTIHFIPSLGPGGAEAFLCSYYGVYPSSHKNHFVITLFSRPDTYNLAVTERGVQTLCLLKPDHYPHFIFLILNSLRSNTVLVGWLYIGNLLASLYHIFLLLLFRPPILHIWNIRCSLDLSKYGLITRLSFFLNILFSCLPGKIMFNSSYSYRTHRRYLPFKKGVVTPNGTDSSLFTYSHKHRAFYRASLGFSDDQFLLGTVGRNRPEKGFNLLYHVFCGVLDLYPDLRLVIVGADHHAEPYSAHPSITILPHSHSVHEIYSMFDLYLQTSLTESYPNTLAEAMSSSLPCLSTNVGDSKVLLNDSDQICSSFGTADLANSLVHLLSMSTIQLSNKGASNSERIASYFDRKHALRYYRKLLSDS